MPSGDDVPPISGFLVFPGVTRIFGSTPTVRMTRFSILCCLSLLMAGCGDPAEETRRSLRGTWISGAYLDTLHSTGSPARAAAFARGVLDFHYDPLRDSAVIGVNGQRYSGRNAVALLGGDSIDLSAGGFSTRFGSPRGADRLLIAGVELRRVSHVPEVTVGEYLVNRYFVANYIRLDSSGRASSDSVAITSAGAVKGLGDVVALAIAADTGHPWPESDILAFETMFPSDTLYYSWRFHGDTLTAIWKPRLTDSRKSPPEPPGFTLRLLRQTTH